jgi:hypothetical protein
VTKLARFDRSAGDLAGSAGPSTGRKISRWLIPAAAVATVLAGTAVGIGAVASRRLFSQLPGYARQSGDDE